MLFKGGIEIICYIAKKKNNETSSFQFNAPKAGHAVFSTGLSGVRVSAATVAAWCISSAVYFYQLKAHFCSWGSNSPNIPLWINFGHFNWHLPYWNDQATFLMEAWCWLTLDTEKSQHLCVCVLSNVYSTANKAKRVQAWCNFSSSLCWQSVLCLRRCRKPPAALGLAAVIERPHSTNSSAVRRHFGRTNCWWQAFSPGLKKYYT